MARKKREDLLGPIGTPEVDYIRGRLRRRILLELGITMKTAQVDEILRCLDKKASFQRVTELLDQTYAEISMPVWSLEIEPLLVELHGAWRYEGRPEIHKQDLERAAKHYVTSHAMDALMSDCSFPMLRSRGERLDDAAWYSVPQNDRG